MTVTDQDRETAARSLKVSRGLARMAVDVERVAAALAEERERATAPLLAKLQAVEELCTEHAAARMPVDPILLRQALDAS